VHETITTNPINIKNLTQRISTSCVFQVYSKIAVAMFVLVLKDSNSEGGRALAVKIAWLAWAPAFLIRIHPQHRDTLCVYRKRRVSDGSNFEAFRNRLCCSRINIDTQRPAGDPEGRIPHIQKAYRGNHRPSLDIPCSDFDRLFGAMTLLGIRGSKRRSMKRRLVTGCFGAQLQELH